MKTPWLNIWVHPHGTMREIIRTNPRQGFVWLSFIYGLVFLLRIAQAFSLGNVLGLGWILLLTAILSIPVGMGLLSAYSLLLFWLGNLIKGKGDYLSIRAATSWSNVPLIGVLGLWGLMIAVFQNKLFLTPFFSEIPLGWSNVFILLNAIGLLVFSFWALILFLHSLAEAQGFSFWMALLNAVLVGIAVWGIVLILWLVAKFINIMGF